MGKKFTLTLLLLASACETSTSNEVENRAAIVARWTSETTVSQLEALDREAQSWQSALSMVPKEAYSSAYFAETLTETLLAENQLNHALGQRWASYYLVYPAIVDDPLATAFLDWHAELRRRLGPNLHTVVPGLVDDPGCAGDVIQDRLLFRYGLAAQHIPAADLNTPEHPALKILNLWAHQVACLSERQLAQLETALFWGFEAVAGRMTYRNLDPLVPAFARLAAPLQLMVLDARKHRGHYSDAWHWFRRYHAALKNAVSLAGWATGDVMVWDRRYGVMLGFSPCSGPGQTRCTDILTLLDSLADPRALGLGQCGFSAMLSWNPVHFPETEFQSPDPAHGAGLRYHCAPEFCPEADSTPALSNQTNEKLLRAWPQLTSQDLAAIEPLCVPRAADPIGATRDLTECLDTHFNSLLENQNNPFDSFASCMLSAAGVEETPTLGASPWITGVPMGTECVLSDGAGTSSSAVASTDTRPKGNRAEKHLVGSDSQGRPIFSYVYTSHTNAQTFQAIADHLSERPDGLIVVDRASADNSPSNQARLAAKLIESQIASLGGESGIAAPMIAALTAIEVNMTIVMDENGHMHLYPMGEPVRSEIHPFFPEACVDPLACEDTCTSLGRQITELSACHENLLNSFASATGRGEDEIERDLGRVSYPRPDNVDSLDNMGVCLQGTPARASIACGLILCSQGVAARTAGQCGCEGVGHTFLGESQLCAMIRCADGLIPDPATCTCPTGGPAMTLPGGGPIPDPEMWPDNSSRLSLELILDLSHDLPPTYNYPSDLRLVTGSDGRSYWTRR